MLRLVWTIAVALADSSDREDMASPWSCWKNGSWFDCCAQGQRCWGNARRQRKCCGSSPELEPMLTDLHMCSNDVALRRTFRLVSHQQIGFEEDCVSLLVCKPTEGGWRAVRSGLPSCSMGSSAKLVPPLTDHLCSVLDPIPAEMWYDAVGFERVRHRYRFGTAERHHCAVPAWLLVKEETLRLYTLIQANSNVSRVLINIGAADAVMSDPLAGTLRTFPGGLERNLFRGGAGELPCDPKRVEEERCLDSCGMRLHHTDFGGSDHLPTAPTPGDSRYRPSLSCCGRARHEPRHG